MKVKIIQPEEQTFQPIKIEIVIESKEEIKDLFYRLNCPISYIEQGNEVKDCPIFIDYNFFHEIEKLYIEFFKK